jgi:hypothetical protein
MNQLVSQLRKSLDSPLDDIDAIPVQSNATAEQESFDILSALSESSTWEGKCDAIKRTLSLIKGRALSFPDFDIGAILGIVAHLLGTDIRPPLVKFGTLLISAVAQHMLDDFVTYVDQVIPNLLKLTSSGKRIIAEPCKYAILVIVELCHKTRVFKFLLPEAASPTVARRLVVVEACVVAFEHWPRNTIQPIFNEISKTVNALLSDASPEVREGAKTAMNLIGIVPKGGKKSSSLKVARSPPRSPDRHKAVAKTQPIDISSVMPPETRQAADEFCVGLAALVENEDWASLEGLEFALPNSIIAAAQLSPRFGPLLPILPRLFEVPVIREEFRDSIASVLIAADLDTSLVREAMEILGAKTVVTSFCGLSGKEKDVNDFFEMMNHDGFRDLLDNEIRDLIRKSPGAVDVRELVRTGELGEKIDQSQVEQQIDVIVEMLEDPETTENALRFVIWCCERFPRIQIEQLMPVLLKLSSNNVCRPKAFCAVRAVARKADDFVPYLGESPIGEIAIQMLVEFIQSRDVGDAVFKAADVLLGLLESDSLTLRRCAASIIGRLAKTRERALRAKLAKLSPLQRQMIAAWQTSRSSP